MLRVKAVSVSHCGVHRRCLSSLQRPVVQNCMRFVVARHLLPVNCVFPLNVENARGFKREARQILRWVHTAEAERFFCGEDVSE